MATTAKLLSASPPRDLDSGVQSSLVWKAISSIALLTTTAESSALRLVWGTIWSAFVTICDGWEGSAGRLIELGDAH